MSDAADAMALVKAGKKAEIREVDVDARREAFVVAVRRLGIKTVEAPALFGVDRRTFTRWISGVSRVPVGVFLALVQLDNRAYLRRAGIDLDDVARNGGESIE